MQRDKKTARRRRGAAVYTPIAVLLTIVIVLFGVSVFFRIAVIEVTGADKYTPERIISVSGVKVGDNLVIVDASNVAQTISDNLPYLSDVTVEKLVPDKLLIRVVESKPLATVGFEDHNWVIDQTGRVLEEAESGSDVALITIIGMNVEDVIVGKPLVVGGETTKLRFLTNVLTEIVNAGIADDVGVIDMSNIAKISFIYTDTYSVTLGSGEDVAYKLSLLFEIAGQLTPEDGPGRIDVSGDMEPRFIPLED